MIGSIRGLKVETRLCRNVSVRLEIAALIERRRASMPPGFLCKGGRILLCQLTDGTKIFLNSTMRTKEPSLIVRAIAYHGRIFARVTSKYPFNKKSEIFVVRDTEGIHHDCQPYVLPKSASRNAPAINERPSLVDWGRQVQAWWKMEQDDLPPPQQKKLYKNGFLHLCPFDRIPVDLRLDPKLTGSLADIEFKSEGNSRIVVCTIPGVMSKEFYLVENGERCLRPKARSLDRY